jgi:hypothetical protein
MATRTHLQEVEKSPNFILPFRSPGLVESGKLLLKIREYLLDHGQSLSGRGGIWHRVVARFTKPVPATSMARTWGR